MNGQLKHHQVTVSRIVNILGSNDSATKYLEKCLYSVGMGNNDYINNYFLPEIYTTSSLYTPAQYATVLIKEYFHQIKALYNYGARKVALFGIGLIGCTPNAISLYGTDGSVCVNKMNLAASLFNNKLISLVRHLNTNLTDATFIYVDSYGIGSTNVTDLGINVTNIGCCPVTEDGLCSPSETPCQNRSEYAFWDSFHPTEALNKVTSSRSYHAVLPTDTYPIDISHLATSALIMEPNWQGSYTTNKELMES
uniref:GDSL esterase/lipase n=1 Tax=Fagus sylvatica TaxID=28930 RepID=A0A2N9I517_FAGSY